MVQETDARGGLNGTFWYVDEAGALHETSPDGWRNEPAAAELERLDAPNIGDLVVLTKQAKDLVRKQRYTPRSAFHYLGDDRKHVEVGDFLSGERHRFRFDDCEFFRRPAHAVRRRQPELSTASASERYPGTLSRIVGLTYLGGNDSRFAKGQQYELHVTQDSLFFTTNSWEADIAHRDVELDIPRRDLTAVEVSGRGEVTEGGDGWAVASAWRASHRFRDSCRTECRYGELKYGHAALYRFPASRAVLPLCFSRPFAPADRTLARDP